MQHNNNCAKPLTDADAKAIEALWKRYFLSAFIFPQVGFPSNSGGVVTLSHTMDPHGQTPMPNLKINGLVSKSPLANNALYSAETSGGKYLNLYEIMVPEFPSHNGGLSSTQIYIDTLAKYGLQVNSVHFHWTGSVVYPNDHGVFAIHHSSIGLSPLEFSKRTIKALLKVMKVIDERAKKESKSSSSSSSESEEEKPCKKKDKKKGWTWDDIENDQSY